MRDLQEEVYEAFQPYLTGPCLLTGEKNVAPTVRRYFRVMARGRQQDVKTLLHDMFAEDNGNCDDVLTDASHFGEFLYSLPASVSLHSLSAYKEGRILGIDGASAFVVKALELSEGHTVLDLCCAPGAKLAVMAETVGSSGFVVGVDVSIQRLDICRALVKKYDLSNVGLLRLDATTLDVATPCSSQTAYDSLFMGMATRWNRWKFPHDRDRKKRKRSCKGADFLSGRTPQQQVLERLSPKQLPTSGDSSAPYAYSLQFDRVLVDAECTHDGSFRHIVKYGTQWAREVGERHAMVYVVWCLQTFERRVLNRERLATLTQLQQNLLRVGCLHLRPGRFLGGFLIYSTCSLCSRQNEGVVAHVLVDEAVGVSVAPLHSSWIPPSVVTVPVGSEPLGGLRFEPSRSGTSGLFMCRLTKPKSDDMRGRAGAAR